MIIALWITAVLLTLMYLFAGSMKAFRTHEALLPAMPYIEDFAAWQIKAIGVIEIIGALGVILPLATGIAPILTPIAAICLTVVQVGAIVVHVRRGEQKQLVTNVVLLVLGIAVAVLGFLR